MQLSSMVRVMFRDASTYRMPKWVEIRKITTRADYKAFCRIYLDSFGNTFKRKLYLLLMTRDCGYVWLYKGNYIGIYTLTEEEELRVTQDVRFRVLYNFALVTSLRGKGFSRVLLASAITEAAKLGCTEIMLKVNTQNVTALKLYKKNKFQVYRG